MAALSNTAAAENTLRHKPTVLRRWQSLEGERASWFAHWAEITQFLTPRQGRYFVQDRNRGIRRYNNIYDNNGSRALATMAAGLLAGHSSPARPWIELGVANTDVMTSVAVKRWLKDVTKVLLRIFDQGNTYRSLHSIYRELGAFGTGADIILDDFRDVMRHYPLTTGEYCIAADWRGDIVTLYRKFEKPVGEIIKEFGRDACSPAIRQQYDRGNLDAWIPLVHAIEPREDRDLRVKDARNMAWSSVYYEFGAQSDKTPLRESGFPYFPALCPRWDVSGGDIYGNSPGMEALGDIKSLQQEQLRKGQAIDFMTKPPVQMPTSLKDREVEALPGGSVYMDTTGSPGTRNLFQVQLDLNDLLADIQDVRERIRSSFYADLFLMLSNMQDTRMTATEVAERHEEKLLMLGPVLERLNNELLAPLVETTFQRALVAGILPPMPAEMHLQQINVKFISILAQAQRAIGANSLDRFTVGIGTVAQMKPTVLDKFDEDHWADVWAETLGVDPELVLPTDKVAYIRQQRAKMQQQAQQAAMMNAHADTAQKLASAPTQGGGSNALQDILGGLTGYGSPSPEQVAMQSPAGQ